ACVFLTMRFAFSAVDSPSSARAICRDLLGILVGNLDARRLDGGDGWGQVSAASGTGRVLPEDRPERVAEIVVTHRPILALSTRRRKSGSGVLGGVNQF